MTASIPASTKSRGRPATGKGEPVQVRLHPPLMEALDAFRASQEDEPSRPEALRRLAAEGLKAKGYLKN